MPVCHNCQSHYPFTVLIEGKRKNLQSRKYCLTCSPWGKHNTQPLGPTDTKTRQRAIAAKPVRDSIRRTKQKAVDYKGGCCVSCGYRKSLAGLCFHHLDPSLKDFQVSGGAKSWERIRTEIDKCTLLCLNCHAEEHERLKELGRQQ